MKHKLSIVDVAPTLSHNYKELYTLSQMSDICDKIYKISNTSCNNTVICVSDTLTFSNDSSFEVNFPFKEIDWENYELSDYKILPRIKAVSIRATGKPADISTLFELLLNHIKENEMTTFSSYRIVTRKIKPNFLLKNSEKFDIEIQIPI